MKSRSLIDNRALRRSPVPYLSSSHRAPYDDSTNGTDPGARARTPSVGLTWETSCGIGGRGGVASIERTNAKCMRRRRKESGAKKTRRDAGNFRDDARR